MHISVSEGTDSGGVTIAHSMLEMREPPPPCLQKSSEVPLSAGGSTVIAIETSASGNHRRPSLSSSSSDERLNASTHRTFRDAKVKPIGAPDLVMDLPVSSLSSSPREHVSSTSVSPSSSPSPSPRARSVSPQQYHSLDIPLGAEGSSSTPSPDMTAAECFAKQNQSTLKKTPVTKSPSGILTNTSSTDAQTQTLLQAEKSSLSAMKSTSIDVSQLSELKITEGEDTRSEASLRQQRSMDCSSSRHSDMDSPLVEVRSAAPPPHPITPNTPRLAARYLQAVAAASGSSPREVAPKPQVRVKPTVMKKPSVSPADSDSDQPSK